MSAATETPTIQCVSIRGEKTYHQHDWTAAMVARLEALWAEGLSTIKIGQLMGLTKNAIIGKSRRLDLPARPAPMVREYKRSEKPPAPPRAPRVTLPPLPSTPPVYRLPTAVNPPSAAALRASAASRASGKPSFLDNITYRPVRREPAEVPYSLFKTCQTVKGSSGFGHDFKVDFCDVKTVPGRSYCADCCKRYYVKVPGRAA